MPLFFGSHCPSSGFFVGCRCPGCGMTHALSALMHGNLHAAIDYNILVVPLSLVVLYLIISSIIHLYKITRQ
ncbi:MAG: DUF2752 domain-containing protein [Patescibacteria group bacterium]